MTTAQAYLISLNLSELLYSPELADQVFYPEYQKSSNEVDVFLKDSFERIVRTCDLTQASQMHLSANPKFSSLVAQGRYQTHFFLESSQSTSSHINAIMSRNVPSKSNSKKLPAEIDQKSASNEEKQIGKLRKRLYHEFRNMINDERSFCRTS